MWSPIYLKVYYDFGDCSFILMNVWKVGCICSTVTRTKFTVTKCINVASQEYIDPHGNSISEPIGPLLLWYCVVFCNYDLSRVILDVWMCKQDICYSAIPDLAPGINGSSCCNVFFFVILRCLYFCFVLFWRDCKSVTNIMYKFEVTIMLLVIQ